MEHIDTTRGTISIEFGICLNLPFDASLLTGGFTETVERRAVPKWIQANTDACAVMFKVTVRLSFDTANLPSLFAQPLNFPETPYNKREKL